MPLGIRRLNPHARPANTLPHSNDRITFIKALPGLSADTAHDFLSRIAAICVPIMRKHHFSITTLEEHEPNREFIGRNFNGGEIIQLVLKARGSGRWLPFRMVAGVMMHELAHCVHMNHSRAFWGVKNVYSEDLKGLWAKGYTGEGLWGRGRALYDGQVEEGGALGADDVLPENLCGGTYRSRGRKRKRGAGQQLSYAERKQKRIEKKFGKNGEALGDDEETKMLLERHKRVSGKPRVAKSKRGRDLRAAAAILRLEQQASLKEQQEQEQQQSVEEATDDESEFEEENDGEDAVDVDGSKLLDSRGHGMIKVCGDDECHHDEAHKELKELGDMLSNVESTSTMTSSQRIKSPDGAEEDSSTESETEDEQQIDSAPPQFSRPRSENSQHENIAKTNVSSNHASGANVNGTPGPPSQGCERADFPAVRPAATAPQPPRSLSATSTPAMISEAPEPRPTPQSSAPTPSHSQPEAAPSSSPEEQICAVCSLSNGPESLTCAACAHVLDAERLPRHWKCQSETCKGGVYVNSEDAGVCGVCGRAKSTEA